MNLREILDRNKDLEYQKFSEKLTIGAKIIGVRMPILRQIANEVAKKDKISFLDSYKCKFQEEFLIYAIVLGKLQEKEKIKYAKKFIPKINNWAVCDLFCGELRARNLTAWKKMITPFKDKEQEFQARAYFVFGLKYLVKDQFVDEFLENCALNTNEARYVQMAVAWALCELFVNYRDKTLALFQSDRLDKFTKNTAIDKMRDSLRITDEDKQILKLLRRRK